MKFFNHLEGIFSNKLGITKDIYTLFKLEAKLAGLNIQPLLVSFSFLIAFVISLWLTLMLLTGDLIYILTKQPLIAILIVLLANLIATLMLMRSLKYRLRQMSFARTRDCLSAPRKRSDSEPTEERAIKVD